MKRSLLAALVIGLCSGAALLAADAAKKGAAAPAANPAKTMTAKGTVTRVDAAGKMMTMKNARGEEMTVYWDDATKTHGDIVEGSMATVHYEMKDGRMMASAMVMRGTMKSEKKKEQK